jgi:hypothetical protein
MHGRHRIEVDRESSGNPKLRLLFIVSFHRLVHFTKF